MNGLQRVKVEGLERHAALLETQAEEREARAAFAYGGGSFLYFQSMEKAEEYRAEARNLQERATQLRRQSA